MADETAETTPGASLQVFRQPLEPGVPGLTLIRLVGTGLDGQPFTCQTTFHTVRLTRQLFGPMFDDALNELLTASVEAVTRVHDRESSIVELKLLAQDALKGVSFEALLETHALMKLYGQMGVKLLDEKVREFAGIAVMNALDRLTGEHEEPAPAQAETDRASPPHADTSSLADRVSNSTGVAGGEDLLSERLRGPGGELAA